MATVLLTLGVGACAVAAAWVLQRRTPTEAVTADWTVPERLDRADFSRATGPFVFVAFTDRDCRTCAETWRNVRAVSGGTVSAVQVDYRKDRAVHDRYGIDAVPTVVLAGPDGVVVASFLGPTSEADLRAALP